MLVMIGYIFIFKMVKKTQKSVLEIVAGLTLPLTSGFESVTYSPGLFQNLWLQQVVIKLNHF